MSSNIADSHSWTPAVLMHAALLVHAAAASTAGMCKLSPTHTTAVRGRLLQRRRARFGHVGALLVYLVRDSRLFLCRRILEISKPMACLRVIAVQVV